jgi:hypothetical protein
MIRILVLANDSLLGDMIVSMLSHEIDIDVVRMKYRELGQGDRYSVVIFIDEGESESESIKVTDLLREDLTLLLIKLSLKSRNIFVYESYQLNNPRIARVIDLVRDFGETNLKKKVEEALTISLLPEMTVAHRFESMTARLLTTIDSLLSPRPDSLPNSFSGTVRRSNK